MNGCSATASGSSSRNATARPPSSSKMRRAVRWPAAISPRTRCSTGGRARSSGTRRRAPVNATVSLRGMYDRMDAELQRDPGRSRPTTGSLRPRARWASSTAHGTRPWPGWVRASMAGSRADALRTDIDRLVLTGIIPDRARAAARRRPQSAAGRRHDGHRVGAIQAGVGDAAQHDRGARAIAH